MIRFLASIFLVCNCLLVFAQGEVFILTSDKMLNHESFSGYASDILVKEGTYCAAMNRTASSPEVIHSPNQIMTEQEMDMWCWAACIEMVLKYQGGSVTQQEIVRHAFGELVNKGANCYEITSTIDGWELPNGRISASYADMPNCDEIVYSLANKYPLIVGLNIPGQDIGHAYVLSACYFQRDQSGNKKPIAVALRDPWPPDEDLTHITWKEFESRLNCVVYVTKE